MDKNSVKVTIYGSEYLIKGDADPDHIHAIAEYVDQKMREINKSGAIKSTLKVAILAALNVTDEFFRSREDQGRQIESYETKAQRLIELLKSSIAPTDPPAEKTEKSPGGGIEEMTLFTQG